MGETWRTSERERDRERERERERERDGEGECTDSKLLTGVAMLSIPPKGMIAEGGKRIKRERQREREGERERERE